ncbi:VQ motif-containing protein 17-like [Typha latifolia]|uniref:VQ motif-containing protein 17-like n=1 Tax=Typha latifolia TaxID=4733 RepID=UPI003C2EBD00
MEDIKDSKAGNRRSETLALHKDSHTVSKIQPKIRIVHIFAPEIIKTDVKNFRELVQRLTGKPTKSVGGKKKAVARRKADALNMGSRYGCQEPWRGEKVKEEMREDKGRMMCMESRSGGFLSGLEEMDGFFQELGDFPLLPF